MRYPIIIHPDERLLKKAEPIEYITDEIVALLDDMYETMVAHDGIGLAAPQIGKIYESLSLKLKKAIALILLILKSLKAKGRISMSRVACPYQKHMERWNERMR